MLKKLIFRLLFALAATSLGLRQANAQTEFPPAYNNQAHYAVGDLVTDYGNIYRCEVAVTKPYLDPSKTYQNWELFYVRNNTTLVIGVQQTFPTLAVAWSYVQNCRVAPAVYLHLSISTANGLLNETFNNQLNLDHVSGSQISILGDSAANITLTFPDSMGFYLDTNHAFGAISHLTLVGVVTNGAGIYGGTGASYADIDNVTVKSFGPDVYAQQSATMIFNDNISLTGVASSCIADSGATILFNSGVSASGAAAAGLEEFYVDHGGRISAEYSTFQNCYTAVYATHGGYVDVKNSSFTSYFNGCWSNFGGNITAENCTFNGASGGTDLLASDLGMIDAIGDVTTNRSADNGAMIFTD